jgi:hypothetical protein
MNENKNPLQSLPKIQRYQIMVILSLMWTTIFCVAIGSWYWWGELVIGHVAVATGVLFTGLTFRAARKKTHRDVKARRLKNGKGNHHRREPGHRLKNRRERFGPWA